MYTQILHLGLLLSLLVSGTSVSAKVIHKERSLYQTILVNQEHKLLCLKFSVRREQRNQTCIDRSDPKRMVFAYTKMMMATLLFDDNPKRILIIGLGGGTLPLALNELYPQATIDVVEIDPAVVKVARSHFNFSPTDKVTTHTLDARVFTKRLNLTLTDESRYNLILLDAFNGEYIPEHLMTQEYFQETAALLAPGGIVAANTFAISKLYHHESVTFESVFGPLLNFTSAETGNRVMIASPSRTLDPTSDLVKQRAQQLALRLRPYDIQIEAFPEQLNTVRDWDTQAKLLTDKYNPANLLRRQKR